MISNILIFVGSLVALITASNLFINSSEKVGKALGISSFLVGATILAFGTSLPELVTSIIAVQENTSGVVTGNVVGSNITNVLLVLGLAAIFSRPLIVERDMLNNDISILLGSSFLMLFACSDLSFSPIESAIFFIAFLGFIGYAMQGHQEEKLERIKVGILPYIWLPVSAIVVYFSARYTIVGLKGLSTDIGVDPSIISLTALALGTSLPEVVVSISAARKGLHSMAVGNILGSNAFNTFAVMSIPSFFGNLEITDAIVEFSLPFMVAVSVLFSLVCISKRVSIWEGGMMLCFYVFYLGQLIQAV